MAISRFTIGLNAKARMPIAMAFCSSIFALNPVQRIIGKTFNFQAKCGFTAINLILLTFPSTISRSSLLGGGVNSSPGQHAIALTQVRQP